MKSRYVISTVQPLAGGYMIRDRTTGLPVGIVWSRRLARQMRDRLVRTLRDDVRGGP